jgi:RNA recognition motif-containing protein
MSELNKIEDMHCMVTISNLPFSTTQDMLKDVFDTVGGAEKISMALDPETKHFIGYAFVTMSSSEAADEAVRKLQGRDCGGRPIRIEKTQSHVNEYRKALADLGDPHGIISFCESKSVAELEDYLEKNRKTLNFDEGNFIQATIGYRKATGKQ